MFGYVRAHAPELRVREYEAYRAVYCGLCRSMGKCTGQCSRMTLSYDFAFLAIVRMALLGETGEFEKKRCFVHPLRRRTVMKRNDQLDACARLAAILAYHKLSDDIADERGGKRLLARLAKPMMGRMRRRAVRDGGYEGLDAYVRDRLLALRQIEKEDTISVDQPADLFGALLSHVVSADLDGTQKRLASKIGYHIGRWIYMVDALDDYQDDVKKGRYNPFARMYPSPEEMARAREGIEIALKNELVEAETAFDLIADHAWTPILQNIIYMGMPKTVEGLQKKGKDKGKKATERTDW